MSKYSQALVAAFALAAGAALAGAAKADSVIYYNSGDGYSTAPQVYTYSDPVIVAPAPQVYYAPIYTQRQNTTYYYGGSNHEGYVQSSPGYTTYYERRVVYPAPPATTYYYSQPTYSQPTYVAPPQQPYGYVPPGLSITTPSGTYAPFYGGWSSYSIESDGYRVGR